MPSQDDDLLQLLISAKLAGSRGLDGGYWFRSNEEAARLALDVLGDWLQEHVDIENLPEELRHEFRAGLSMDAE